MRGLGRGNEEGVLMSNELLNYHVCDGEPVGEEAELSEIAEYYGSILFEIRPRPQSTLKYWEYLQSFEDDTE